MYMFCFRSWVRCIPIFNRQALFRVGNKKVRQELDAVTMVKTVRQVRFLTRMLLNKKQRTLLKLQDSNLLKKSSSSESELEPTNIIHRMHDYIDDESRIKTNREI